MWGTGGLEPLVAAVGFAFAVLASLYRWLARSKRDELLTELELQGRKNQKMAKELLAASAFLKVSMLEEAERRSLENAADRVAWASLWDATARKILRDMRSDQLAERMLAYLRDLRDRWISSGKSQAAIAEL